MRITSKKAVNVTANLISFCVNSTNDPFVINYLYEKLTFSNKLSKITIQVICTFLIMYNCSAKQLPTIKTVGRVIHTTQGYPFGKNNHPTLVEKNQFVH